jgi:hypothetical protein
MCEG